MLREKKKKWTWALVVSSVLLIGFACILPVVFGNCDVLNSYSTIQPVVDFCDPVYVRDDVYEILTSKPLIVQNERSCTTIKDGGKSGTNELSNGQIHKLTLGKRVLSLRDSADTCETKEDALLIQFTESIQQDKDYENF